MGARARAGRFPDKEPPRDLLAPAHAMGFGAGGTIRQKIYSDPYGIDEWDCDNSGTATVHVLNVGQYAQLRAESVRSRQSAWNRMSSWRSRGSSSQTTTAGMPAQPT